jgi:hypothetical protein
MITFLTTYDMIPIEEPIPPPLREEKHTWPQKAGGN